LARITVPILAVWPIKGVFTKKSTKIFPGVYFGRVIRFELTILCVIRILFFVAWTCMGETTMSSLSLYERFKKIPDPRRPAGTRYSLASVLALVVAAVLCGRTSLRAIARWGKTLTQPQLLELGIKRNRAPGQTAMHELLCRLPASEVEKALGDWIGELAAREPSRQIVLDGKTLRVSAPAVSIRPCICWPPTVRKLTAFCPGSRRRAKAMR
jgi:hypothetical protein